MDTLPAAVYLLIERFVQRQPLTFEAIQKLRPYLIDSTQRLPNEEDFSAAQLGYWGQDNEWKYFLYGGGCRLTHTITGEVFDWDAPDLNRFDAYSFMRWLAWFLKQNVFFRDPVEDEAVSIIATMVYEQSEEAFRKKILDVLQQLHQEGKLRRFSDRTNKYGLIV